MFSDKFLLWKVFPVCCLRWILQFAILERPPDSNSLAKVHNTRNFLDTLQHLVAVWSKKEFVQSAPMEQQTCILHVFIRHLILVCNNSWWFLHLAFTLGNLVDATSLQHKYEIPATYTCNFSIETTIVLLYLFWNLLSLNLAILDVSAAVGLSLEKMSKEELDETKDVMHSILKGVSCKFFTVVSISILSCNVSDHYITCILCWQVGWKAQII